MQEFSLELGPSVEDDNAREFCRAFALSSSRRFVLGRNNYAASIGEQFSVEAYIDDFAAAGEEFNSRKVIKSTQIPEGALVVNCAINGLPVTAAKKLSLIKGIQSLDFFSFRKHIENACLPDLNFADGACNDFLENRGKYNWIFNLLDDAVSKEVFRRILSFRLSQRLSFMNVFEDKRNQQYFEPFLNLRKSEEVFLDVGSFDGFTSKQFAERCPSYSAIHAFEPDEKNFLKVTAALDDYERLFLHPYGLSDANGTQRFKVDGSASRIAEDGDVKVSVRRLDDIYKEPPTFIKMDIEGGEKSALLGARECIRKNNPKLAICVYHCVDDLWKIPELIFDISDDYNIFLRHYTEGPVETVMFFVPST